MAKKQTVNSEFVKTVDTVILGYTTYNQIIIPIILGGGVRLFKEDETNTINREIKLKLLSTKTYNGMTDLIYERK